MTSVLRAHPGDIKPSLPPSPTKSVMQQAQEPTPPHNIKQEPEPERGRPRSRSDKGSNGDGLDGDGADDGNGANSSNSEGPARKRRRSRKGLDKKFECPAEGCGKSYSRAEHL